MTLRAWAAPRLPQRRPHLQTATLLRMNHGCRCPRTQSSFPCRLAWTSTQYKDGRPRPPSRGRAQGSSKSQIVENRLRLPSKRLNTIVHTLCDQNTCVFETKFDAQAFPGPERWHSVFFWTAGEDNRNAPNDASASTILQPQRHLSLPWVVAPNTETHRDPLCKALAVQSKVSRVPSRQ